MNRRQPPVKPLNVCIAISGGIAAYKVPLLIRALRKRSCEIKVVLTRAAQPLVGVQTLRTLSGNPVYTDNDNANYDMDHIRLAGWADCLCICPATANTIAKLAHGIADNLCTTLALAFDGPVIIAPAMNSVMWRKSVTQNNIRTLTASGARVLGVEDGELACGEKGPGRMCPVETITESILASARPRLLDGLRVLISSGPTAERIDPVRIISNRSSGKMGAALAAESLAMGADVTVVHGPSEVPPPSGAKCIAVMSADEMYSAMEQQFAQADICIMAAAVSDFKPLKKSGRKLPRTHGNLQLELVPTSDIAAQLGARKRGQFLIGFALEDHRDISRAMRKMRDKHCDMMILNETGTAIGSDTNEITILLPGAKPQQLPSMDKRSAAGEILTRAVAARNKRHD